MDEETIKQYQEICKFEDITWANTANDDFLKLPQKEQTYFFVETNGAIYIGTVLKKTGVNSYITRIEKNINNKLKVADGNETQILIEKTDPGKKMFLWAKIPNYNNIKEDINNKLKVKEGNTIGIKPEEKIVTVVEISNNDSIDNLVDELSTLTVNNKQKINDFLNNKALKEDEDYDDDDYNELKSINNNSSRGPVVKVQRKHKRITGSRFGGKGRKKTKRNKNKNKKRKTHRKR